VIAWPEAQKQGQKFAAGISPGLILLMRVTDLVAFGVSALVILNERRFNIQNHTDLIKKYRK